MKQPTKTTSTVHTQCNDLLMHKKRELWNRCDECGRFISYEDFYNGIAVRYLKTPDSELSAETYYTLCRLHAN